MLRKFISQEAVACLSAAVLSQPLSLRRNILAILVAIGAFASVARAGEALSPADRFRGGKVEWARLKHVGQYWNRHAESDDALLNFIRSNTTLGIDSAWHTAPANDLASLTVYPFIFADTLRFTTEKEQDNLAEYLRRGGFLCLDACGNVKINHSAEEYLDSHLRILRRMFPDLRVIELKKEHEIFSIYFKMSAFPPQTRPGDSWLDGPTNPLRLLCNGDKVIGVMSISGLQCAWSGVGKDQVSPMKMMTNIYLYAITR